jgi:hypothetical protein
VKTRESTQGKGKLLSFMIEGLGFKALLINAYSHGRLYSFIVVKTLMGIPKGF